jgi:hypothetical protein
MIGENDFVKRLIFSLTETDNYELFAKKLLYIKRNSSCWCYQEDEEFSEDSLKNKKNLFRFIQKLKSLCKADMLKSVEIFVWKGNSWGYKIGIGFHLNDITIRDNYNLVEVEKDYIGCLEIGRDYLLNEFRLGKSVFNYENRKQQRVHPHVSALAYADFEETSMYDIFNTLCFGNEENLRSEILYPRPPYEEDGEESLTEFCVNYLADLYEFLGYVSPKAYSLLEKKLIPFGYDLEVYLGTNALELDQYIFKEKYEFEYNGCNLVFKNNRENLKKLKKDLPYGFFRNSVLLKKNNILYRFEPKDSHLATRLLKVKKITVKDVYDKNGPYSVKASVLPKGFVFNKIKKTFDEALEEYDYNYCLVPEVEKILIIQKIS